MVGHLTSFDYKRNCLYLLKWTKRSIYNKICISSTFYHKHTISYANSERNVIKNYSELSEGLCVSCSVFSSLLIISILNGHSVPHAHIYTYIRTHKQTNTYNSMNCTCIICIVLLWLIPHPIVIGLIYGSMECNKDVCTYKHIQQTLLIPWVSGDSFNIHAISYPHYT
jgi:hypothetical protein